MTVRVAYDEFGMFHENAEEFGIPFRTPTVRRESVELPDGRKISSLVWGTGDPEIVLLHGGGQNAHTWDTVALALDRPLLAIDLPGHGHSDNARADVPVTDGNAEDVAYVIRALAPNARGVVGMSMGGLTTLALSLHAPDLVRSAILVDVTPGVTRDQASQIIGFLSGPVTFADFDEILARTVEFNPTRSEQSLRRGILHNAEQLDDGSWVWRHQRHRLDGDVQPAAEAPPAEVPNDLGFGDLWDAVAQINGPICLARGMRSQSVVSDENEAELLRRNPSAKVVHFVESGHSLQGDEPVKLARLIDEFIPAP
ncbi:MAG: alpha/beta hydrolase [Actinomycetota bacterium]|nr:alpha/beta hydrolase [Actinomycetota bacterium]